MSVNDKEKMGIMVADLPALEQDYGLTDREREVLQLITKGLIKKEIAEKIHLSYHTVDSHMRNIYTKMNVHTGTAAVAKAFGGNPYYY
jgi:DNA-binding CsgD family transcriptional regulator